MGNGEWGIGNWYQLKTKTLCISLLYPSLDPPKSPLKRGTFTPLSPGLFHSQTNHRFVGVVPRMPTLPIHDFARVSEIGAGTLGTAPTRE